MEVGEDRSKVASEKMFGQSRIESEEEAEVAAERRNTVEEQRKE